MRSCSRRSAGSPRRRCERPASIGPSRPRRGAARRSLGSDLRRVRRRPGLWRAGRRGRAACRPRPEDPAASWLRKHSRATAAPPGAWACRPMKCPLGGTRSTRATPGCEEAALRRFHLAVRPGDPSGVGSIMVSYSSWNGVKCSGHRETADRHPQERAGFEGFLISDYNAIDQLPAITEPSPKLRERRHRHGDGAREVPGVHHHAHGAGRGSDVPMARIDDAVLRILRVKCAGPLGVDLVPARGPRVPKLRLRRAPRGRPASRAGVAGAAEERRRTLPLAKPGKRIQVAGRDADDMGMQCGGWTINWQGKRGPVTTGTTILAGHPQGGGVPPRRRRSRLDGSGAAGADPAVVVVGAPLCRIPRRRRRPRAGR